MSNFVVKTVADFLSAPDPDIQGRHIILTSNHVKYTGCYIDGCFGKEYPKMDL